MLTLVIVPAAFSLADSFERWLAPRLSRLLTFKPGDDIQHTTPQPAE
jgi:hypothetical protein